MPTGIPYSFLTLLAFVFIEGVDEDDLDNSSRLAKKKHHSLVASLISPSPGITIINS